ncbi:MAG: hypothetical protein PVSMB7_23690 [Chloroflexota bacterium]
MYNFCPSMIEIVPSAAHWPADFSVIADDLRAALGDRALRIDHIGSTSVPGLAAKDRIDVQVTVRSLEDSDSITQSLVARGYQGTGEIWVDHLPPGWEGPPDAWRKLFFNNRPDRRPANIHIREAGAPNQRYALLFRDYLRLHPAMAAGYAAFKQELGAHISEGRVYAEIKDPVCDIIMAAAEEWAIETVWELNPLDH